MNLQNDELGASVRHKNIPHPNHREKSRSGCGESSETSVVPAMPEAGTHTESGTTGTVTGNHESVQPKSFLANGNVSIAQTNRLSSTGSSTTGAAVSSATTIATATRGASRRSGISGNVSSSSGSGGLTGPSNALRRVTRVSRHAALTTKQAVWDSNELSIEAALSAVDQWEGAYTGLRSLLVHGVTSAMGLYGAAKEGAGKLEHGLLIPVRDWILLPAFTGAERAVTETTSFLQSETALQLASSTLQLTRQVPWMGENFLAPAMCLSVSVVQHTWHVLQYPIPSRQQVRVTVDWSLTATKWALSAAAREICLYAKRADANITRTLSHTQWKVLGSGPYATLDASNKSFVIDHLCERYFAVPTEVARYELAAHIKRHNPALYSDLVSTGLLKERGGDITQDDEWLCASPCYLSECTDDVAFLLRDHATESIKLERHKKSCSAVSALWFRWPNVNGKPPQKDAPWVCFRKREQHALEEKYRQAVENKCIAPQETKQQPMLKSDHTKNDLPINAVGVQESSAIRSNPVHEAPNLSSTGFATPKTKQNEKQSLDSVLPTTAQWYNVNAAMDVMVDQQRHAVSFDLSCPTCRVNHVTTTPFAAKRYGDECERCSRSVFAVKNGHNGKTSFALPPVTMKMRPTFWRFYGPGDDVRRATWFLDTSRHGLQPFDYEAQAILEDAYLFLKYAARRKKIDPIKLQDEGGTDTEAIDESLLTVEVPGPDGTDRLVQFSSITQATAIQKGLGAAIAIFKRRVYRGAWLAQAGYHVKELDNGDDVGASHLIDSLGETIVPDASLRSVLDPMSPVRLKPTSRPVDLDEEDGNSTLAVPADRLLVGDMAKLLRDEKNCKVDHLCLVVHGIGEMLRSFDLFGLTFPNLSSVCGSMRSNHSEVQDAHISFMHSSETATSPAPGGRVEYLPVEWHESFSILTQRRAPSSSQGDFNRNVLIKDVSLPTIPNMREFANDTLMDVLFFMSPEHHQIILDVVAREMNLVVQKFRCTSRFDGRISIIGHSLGSVICWDILRNQCTDKLEPVSLPQQQRSCSTESMGAQTCGASSRCDHGSTPKLNVADTLNEPTRCPQLDFRVDNFFLLGSPVPVFLMIRNQRMPLSRDFYLRGCRRVFNIFHPYDPVAYRLEGCIDPRNSSFDPVLIRHWNGGLRVQYRTRRLWRKLIETTCKTQRTVVEAFEQGMAGTFGVGRDYDDSASESSEDGGNNGVVTGCLNEGRRIDYMLQEKEIENANEYVAALAAHSSYWIEKDLSLFIARQIYLDKLEKAAIQEVAAELASWETIITPDRLEMNENL